MSGEKSKSSTFSDTGEAIAISDVMMTFEFDKDDPWIPQKMAKIEGAKNPVQCFVPKDLNPCFELFAYLRLKHYHTTGDMTELSGVYSSWA